MTSSKQKLIDHLKEHGKDRSWSELTKKFNPAGGDDWARVTARMAGFNSATKQFNVQNKIDWTKHKKENDRFRKEGNELVNRVLELEREIKILADVKEYSPSRYEIPLPTQKRRTKQRLLYNGRIGTLTKW